jgi:hypothetical protein
MSEVRTNEIVLKFDYNEFKKVGNTKKSENFIFEFDDYDPMRLFLGANKYPEYTLMGASPDGDKLHLRHLKVPSGYESQGLGKFAMAFFTI